MLILTTIYEIILTFTFYRVMLAEHIETGEKVALKLMKSSDTKQGKQRNNLFKAEVAALKDLKHPHILKMKDYSEKEYVDNAFGNKIEVSYIALEYANNGEFFDYISESEKYSDKTVRYFFHKLIEILEYMHSNGYSHRDIKPENMLFGEGFSLKMADFGFTTKNEISNERRGTFGYMAPEVLAHFEHDPKKADLFSAGVILFIMATKHCPFIRAEATDKYYSHIVKHDFGSFWKMHRKSNGEQKTFSSEFKDLMNGLLNDNVYDRLTIEQIKAHEWYNGPIATDDEISLEFRLRRRILGNDSSDTDQNEENE
jgi:BR serine/threonine kinase